MTEKKNRSMIQRRLIPTYIFLIIVAFFSVFPFYWMISAATNTTFDVANGKITFGGELLTNFQNLLANYDLWRAMGNSFLYAVVQTLLAIVICSLAGFGFELYHDKWKDRLFSVLLLAMMIPQVADPAVQDAFFHETPEQCMGIHPPVPVDAVPDHDVPSELQELPGRHDGGGPY